MSRARHGARGWRLFARGWHPFGPLSHGWWSMLWPILAYLVLMGSATAALLFALYWGLDR